MVQQVKMRGNPQAADYVRNGFQFGAFSRSMLYCLFMLPMKAVFGKFKSASQILST